MTTIIVRRVGRRQQRLSDRRQMIRATVLEFRLQRSPLNLGIFLLNTELRTAAAFNEALLANLGDVLDGRKLEAVGCHPKRIGFLSKRLNLVSFGLISAAVPAIRTSHQRNLKTFFATFPVDSWIITRAAPTIMTKVFEWSPLFDYSTRMKKFAREAANVLLIVVGILSAGMGLKGFLLSSRL
jgi:hypothetical protein